MYLCHCACRCVLPNTKRVSGIRIEYARQRMGEVSAFKHYSLTLIVYKGLTINPLRLIIYEGLTINRYHI